MRYFRSGDLNGAYPRFPVLISIASGCLGCNGDLIGSCGAVMFCQEIGFGVRRSILLYHLLMTFAQALRISSRSTPLREIFSLGFRDSIRLLINTESFQPVSLA